MISTAKDTAIFITALNNGTLLNTDHFQTRRLFSIINTTGVNIAYSTSEEIFRLIKIQLK
jgi:hypothetical protein